MCGRKRTVRSSRVLQLETTTLNSHVLGLIAVSIGDNGTHLRWAKRSMTSSLIIILGLFAQLPVGGQTSGGGASRAIPLNPPLAVNPLTGLTSTSATNYRPLTGRERLQLYWKQNYWSVGAYAGPFISALVLDQASGTPEEWGGGFEGFGHRLGSRVLSSTIQGNIQAGLAAALREDVRYISRGKGTSSQRLLHAVAFSFVTYNNNGHVTPNVSNLTSYYTSTAISTKWVPTDDSLGRYTLVHGSEQVGLSIAVNILQEFWPDIRSRFLHRKP